MGKPRSSSAPTIFTDALLASWASAPTHQHTSISDRSRRAFGSSPSATPRRWKRRSHQTPLPSWSSRSRGKPASSFRRRGYFAKVRELCTAHNVMLILDEIQTGLGRTGKLLAEQHDGIEADVTLLGKALFGGFYPVSAVLSNNAVLGTLKPGQHGPARPCRGRDDRERGRPRRALPRGLWRGSEAPYCRISRDKQTSCRKQPTCQRNTVRSYLRGLAKAQRL